MNVASTVRDIEKVVLSARSREGIVDVIERDPGDRDINIDPLIVRLIPSVGLGLEIIVRAEGYKNGNAVVSVGEELDFQENNRRDLEIVMNEGFFDDDFDRDGYRLCGTGPVNDDSPCDCDDNLPDVNPFGQEQCGNDVDDDCNGEPDDGC
ncbi:MAG: hypothetical protein ACAI38_01705 [Myxococcota bacterium]